MPPAELSAFSLGPTLLFCPADRPDRYAKAAQRSDAVILDLEDAVAPASKPAARQAVTEYFAELDAEQRETTVVRLNPVTTDDFEKDCQTVSRVSPQYVMLAKAESAEQIATVHRSLSATRLIALCETPAGIAAASDIAAHPATAALMWGAEDLIAAIGGTSSRGPDGGYREVARYARSAVLMAAAAHGKAGVDSIYADIADHDGLATEAEDSVGSGFAAKACIHPGQVEIIRQAYRPTAEHLEYAKALVAEAPNHGGAFQFRGSMVDGPLIRHAERIIARSQ